MNELDKERTLATIIDRPGWVFGLRASLKAAFGTDTELHIRSGGIETEMAEARKEVERMDLGVRNLLDALGAGGPVDEAEIALEAILKKLS